MQRRIIQVQACLNEGLENTASLMSRFEAAELYSGFPSLNCPIVLIFLNEFKRRT